jgi:uncharacterized protein involved in outer membrane biogenesis
MRLKHVLIGLAGLVVVVVGGAAIAIYSVDFNEYRSTIAAQVKQATGRDLKIAGDLKVGISLTPTVAVDNVTFANAAWGSRPEMVRVKRFEAEMELLPLISGDIRVKRHRPHGADILLETDAKGRGRIGPSARAAGSRAPAGGGTGKLPTVNRITFEDATITYKDGVAKKTQTVALRFSAEARMPPSDRARDRRQSQWQSVSASVTSARWADPANQPLPIGVEARAAAPLAAKGTIAKPAAGKASPSR